MEQKLAPVVDKTNLAGTFPGACPSCQGTAETRICMTDIPYFKDVVIFVTDCESCGYRDTEVGLFFCVKKSVDDQLMAVDWLM